MQYGFRDLAAGPRDPAFEVRAAVSRATFTPEPDPRWIGLEAEAAVEVGALRGGRFVAVEVPEVRPDLADDAAGGATRWEIAGVWSGERALRYAATDRPRDGRLSWRAAHRLVIVDLEEPVSHGAALPIRIQWRQRMPFARHEELPTRTLSLGTATPFVPLSPRLAGGSATFPLRAEIRAPEGAEVVFSGTDVDRRVGGGWRVYATEARDGGRAAAVVGRWAGGSADVALTSRFFRAQRSPREPAPGSARGLVEALGRWSGAPIPSGLRLVELPPQVWRMPAAEAWSDLAGLRGHAVVGLDTAEAGRLQRRYPRLDGVLLAEGLAASAFAGRAEANPTSEGWLAAFARAFALAALAAQDRDEEVAWQRSLSACATAAARLGVPASPHRAAPAGLQLAAGRCSGPKIVGPMLDDRLGVEGARQARAAVLSGRAPLDAYGIYEAVVAADPTAADWAQRWILDGHLPALSATFEVAEKERGARRHHVQGTVAADIAVDDTPIPIRLVRRNRIHDLVVVLDGRQASFEADVPFAPTRVLVDPEHRVLRRTRETSVQSHRAF